MNAILSFFLPSGSSVSREQVKLFYWFLGSFIVANTVLIVNEFYWFTALPLALLLGLFAVFSTDILVLIVVFCTPLSVNFMDIGMGVGVSLPAEPLMFGVMILFFLKLLLQGTFDRKVLSHPVSAAILINLLWIGITCITSSMPVVSLKFLLARLWFVSVFYFLGTQLFAKYANLKRYVWAYMIPLAGVVVYTIFNHYLLAFDEQAAHWVMSPFYNDHTAYAAILAMFLPFTLGFVFNRTYSPFIRACSLFLFFLFIAATVLSYTRAAWVSLAAALLVYVCILLKIKFRTVFITLGVLAALFFTFQSQIYMKLEKNRQDSSSDYEKHIQSIANISTDASNLERINRWRSALRMFMAKPVFGWGPGTYSFKYAPFQQSGELTVISTNAGDLGNAHSEYIGPLAESGLAGALTFVLIAGIVIYRALKLYATLPPGELRMIVLCTLLGLITYFTHAMLNNFLDTDKASVPFWGFIAILTAAEVYHRQKAVGS